MSFMSLNPFVIPRTIVNAMLDMLIPLLMTGAGGDLGEARQAALEMIAEYGPETREEYRLAAEIISFGLQALGMLRDAAMPGVPNGAKLKLLNTACSLRRNE